MGTVPLGASGEHSASHLTPGRASSPSSWLMSPPPAGCQHSVHTPQPGLHTALRAPLLSLPPLPQSCAPFTRDSTLPASWTLR